MQQTELFQSPFKSIVRPKKKREMSEFTKLKRDLYEQYKLNMKLFGKEDEIESYREWLKNVNSVNI